MLISTVKFDWSCSLIWSNWSNLSISNSTSEIRKTEIRMNASHFNENHDYVGWIARHLVVGQLVERQKRRNSQYKVREIEEKLSDLV